MEVEKAKEAGFNLMLLRALCTCYAGYRAITFEGAVQNTLANTPCNYGVFAASQKRRKEKKKQKMKNKAKQV